MGHFAEPINQIAFGSATDDRPKSKKTHKKAVNIRMYCHHGLRLANENRWDTKTFHFYCAHVIYRLYLVRSEAFHYVLRLFSYAIQIFVAFLFVRLKRIVS